MKKLFLFIAIIFVVKVAFTQTNQPFYNIPTINTPFKQNIPAGSLVITKDSCRSFYTSAMLATGSTILATPKIRAFPKAENGNFSIYNEKITPTIHALGISLVDGTSRWQMGLIAGGDTVMSMYFKPAVGKSNVVTIKRDSVIIGCQSSVNPSYTNRMEFSKDSIYLSLSNNHATRWDNLGNLIQYKDFEVRGNTSFNSLTLNTLFLPNIPTTGLVDDSMLVVDQVTSEVKMKPQGYPLTNILYVDGRRVDVYTPTGSQQKPFLTITAAITYAATLASDVNRYVVVINPATYVEDVAMKQFISIRGADIESTIIEGTVTWDATNLDLAGNEIALLTISQTNAPAIVCSAGEAYAYMGIRSCYLTVTWDTDDIIKHVVKLNSGYLEVYGTTYIEEYITNQGDGFVHQSTMFYDASVFGSGIATKTYLLGISCVIQVADTTDDVSLFYSTKDNIRTQTLIKDGYFRIYLTEIMTINVQPATVWKDGDVIEGQTSGATCEILENLTPTTYRISGRSGVFTDGEIIGVVGNLADQNIGAPDFGIPHRQSVSGVCHYQSKGTIIFDNNIVFNDIPYGSNTKVMMASVRDSYSPSSIVQVSNSVFDINNILSGMSYFGASTTCYDQLLINNSQIASLNDVYPKRDTVNGYAGVYQVIGTSKDGTLIGGKITTSELVVNLSTVGRGAISVGAGGTAVTGLNGTDFINDFRVGDIIMSEGQTKTIASIIDETHLTTNAWGAAIICKGYNIVGGDVFKVHGNGDVIISGTTNTEKLIVNDSLLVHGNAKIDSSLVVVRNITADSLKINAIEFSDNTVQTTKGLMWTDTVSTIATQYDLSLKENPLTFNAPLMRSVNTVSLNDTIAGNMYFLDDVKIDSNLIVSGNITGDTLKPQAVQFPDSRIQTTIGIPQPVVAASGQFLKYNGVSWIPANIVIPVSSGAAVTYFLEDSASAIPTYESLFIYPLGLPEDIEPVTVNNDSLLIDAYVTDSTTGLGLTMIDGGIWTFETYAKVDDVSGLSEILIYVYRRDTSGVESLMFNTTTGEINSTSVSLFTSTYVDSSHVVNPTDMLVVKYYGKTDNVGNIVVSLYHSGSAHYSYVVTPITTTHNQLKGLDGGNGSNEYYHLTQVQDSIATQSATGSRDGYLTSANWTTFNNKLAWTDTVTTIATQYDLSLKANKSITVSAGTGLMGGGDLSANRTISADSTSWIPTDYDVSLKVPTTRTISTTAPLSGGGALSANLTLSIPVATNIANGYLSSVDWTTFNGKESALTFSTGLTRAVNTITSNLSTGVAGGQSVIGGTALGNNLTLSSTSNVSKGSILFGTGSYNESTNTLLTNSINFGVQSIATAAGTTTLLNTSPFHEIFTGATTQNCDLPNATTLSNGQRYKITNNSTGLVTLRTSGGATLWILGSLTEVDVVLTNNGSVAGTWDKYYKAINSATGKVSTFNNSVTYTGTDGTTITTPAATSTLLANNLGLSGNTTLIGGTGASGTLTLQSTSDATKGNIRIGTSATQYFNYAENTNITTIGNSGTATNYAQFAADGSFTLVGTARKYKIVSLYPYNIYGYAATFNAVVCTATALVAIGVSPMKFMSTGYSSANNANNSAICAFELPTDYEAGTDVIVEIDWTVSSSATANVRWGCGLSAVGVTENLTTAHTFAAEQTVAIPAQYIMKETTFTFTGTNFNPRDNVGIVVYRNKANAADTYTLAGQYAQVSMISIKYISNKIGE